MINKKASNLLINNFLIKNLTFFSKNFLFIIKNQALKIIMLLFACFFLTLYFAPEFFYHYLNNQNPKFSVWLGEDRPTLVYALPSRIWTGELESMSHILIGATKMGWNVISHEEALTKDLNQLKNAFGLFIVNSNGYNVNFPKNIPVFVLNNFAQVDHKTFLEQKTSWDQRESLEQRKSLEQKKLLEQRKSLVQKIKSLLYYPDYLSLPKQFVGLLLTSSEDIDIDIEKNLDVDLHNVKFIISWYLTVPKTTYRPNPKKLMFAGAKYVTNIRTESQKYQTLWKKLDQQPYFSLYGPESHWENYNSYKHYIPADGKSFIKEINKNGICLILHNDKHLKAGIPSGRIFEAAAAAAVIISDLHPFVLKEFKDSVLYIDQNRDDLFEQIDAHMLWIKTHPTEAKALASRAHKIFLERFTQEQQLEKLYARYLQVKNDKNY